MMPRNSSIVLALVAALALGIASGARAQTRKKAHRARRAAAAAAAVAPNSTGAEQAAGSGFGVSESLSGKIEMVVPEQNLLVISGPNGVPYDLLVTDKTVLVVGDKRGTLASLADHVGAAVSAGFVPERDGNHATRIEVTG